MDQQYDEEYVPTGDEYAFDESMDEVVDDQDHSASSAPVGGLVTLPNPLYRLRLPYSHETFLAGFEGNELTPRSRVVVTTRYGRDLATIIGIVKKPGYVNPADVAMVERVATPEDLAQSDIDTRRETEAFKVCREKISAHHLDMKLVSVHYLLDEPKILFFFTAENRVDFRELVKDLVGIFKTRIELRQIGVRDESRVVGGLGVCGRGYCCHAVSDKLKPVSIKMAKDQNLSLNSMKISGPCGRLLCCLSYEHSFYHEERRTMPPEGCRVIHGGVTFKVTEVNPLAGKIKLHGEDGRTVELLRSQFERTDGRWKLRDDAIIDTDMPAQNPGQAPAK
ncbi:MAG: regulatory iron-sulfur-containing complex subunit RicT [Treponemataceae bacterium]